jgi:uncharacterized protein (TIGR00369 family)
MGARLPDMQTRVTNSFRSQRFMTTLGAQLVSVAEGEVQIALPFSEQLSQQHGYLHAGVLTSVVDTACGYAALTKAPPDCEVVTAEFKINFLRPAIGERFIAVGRALSSGRFLSVCTGEVHAFTGSESKVVAVMQATIASVPGSTHHPDGGARVQGGVGR